MLKGRAAGTLEPVKPEALLGPCWHYVGSFFALGRLFLALGRHLRVCWAFFTHVRLFFRVLGGAGSDFQASGDNLEGPKLLFLVFCCPRMSAMRKNGTCAKTTVFPVFLYGFYILRALSSSHKTTQIIPGACPTELPAKIVLQSRLGMDSGRVWCSLGRHLTGLCALLGGCWLLLGTSWASALDIPPLKQLK